MNILVVGSINMDLVINTPKMPEMGETLIGSGFETIPGGKGANQAIACGKLGGQVKMCGCVGDDVYGDVCIQNLLENNVDTEYIEKVPTNTGIAVITVCRGDNCIILEPGANKFASEDFIDRKKSAIEWADLVILQLEIPLEAVEKVAKLAHQLGKKVVLNPAPMQPLSATLLANVDILVPNQIEAGDILGRPIVTSEDAQTGVRDLMEMGIETVIITLGEDGCVYGSKENNVISYLPAIQVKPVDTTAAGDSFIGGLCIALGKEETLEAAIDFATRVAAITVTRKGASISIPTLDELE